MKIALASDLHLEFPTTDRRRALDFPADSSVIALIGDIHIGRASVEIMLELAELYPCAHIVAVAGNHEFYAPGNIDRHLTTFREMTASHERIHFLENDAVDISGIRFMGCTLWTDFSILGDSTAAMDKAGRMINDFRMIATRPAHRFTPSDAALRFEQSRQFLEQELAVCLPESTVVLTHFPPGLATRNTRFPLDPITAYFQSNVESLIDQYHPAIWLYGHNHHSNDLYRGRTRLVSNQLGYPREAGHIPSYNAEKTIVLGSMNGNRDEHRL